MIPVYLPSALQAGSRAIEVFSPRVRLPDMVPPVKASFASKAVCNPDVFAIERAESAIAVVFPVEVTTHVKFALVVTVPAVRLEAVPVMLVPTKAEGVPAFPLKVTKAPDEPTFVARAVATPVHGVIPAQVVKSAS